MIDKVGALMREVAATTIMPRFRNLADHEIHAKGPGDLVTVADREAEELLTAGLTAIIPGSIVVGEEAVAADPHVLDRVAADGSVWVVDPVDGTGNFAKGEEPFAVMVGLLSSGTAVAGWILDPVADSLAVASRGAGAFVDGVRVRCPTDARPASALRGPAFTWAMPDRPALDASTIGERLRGHFCAGYEYPAVVRDEQQFVFFWRTYPWDHVPGALIVQEAGGVVTRLDGSPYVVGDQRSGLLAATSQETWDTVRATLLAPIP